MKDSIPEIIVLLMPNGHLRGISPFSDSLWLEKSSGLEHPLEQRIESMENTIRESLPESYNHDKVVSVLYMENSAQLDQPLKKEVAAGLIVLREALTSMKCDANLGA